MDGVLPTFRVPGYPVIPAIFILSSAVMTVLSIRDDPKTTGMWLGVLAAGVPVFFVWRKLSRGRATDANRHGFTAEPQRTREMRPRRDADHGRKKAATDEARMRHGRKYAETSTRLLLLSVPMYFVW